MPTKKTSKDRSLFVIHTGKGWTVKRSGASRVAGVYGTQAEALAAARQRLQEKGGQLRIQGVDGRWRESFTVGRGSMDKLNAIEGTRISTEFRRALNDFDRRGVSADQRRREIEQRFRKG